MGSDSIHPKFFRMRAEEEDPGLCSHPKNFWGNGIRTYGVTPREKSLLPEAKRRVTSLV